MTIIKPVFILGSPRSGTTLLNSVFFSTKKFALYQSETHLMDKCAPVYGDLSDTKNYQRFLQDWLQSVNFERANLCREKFAQTITKQDRQSYACFLKRFMDQIAIKQGLDHWVDSTPSNVFHIDEIIATFPEVKIVHVIRDGRDVAQSIRKLGWHGCKSNDDSQYLLYAALNWQEAVIQGRKAGERYPEQYMELHYENLVNEPGKALSRLSDFIGVRFCEQQVKKVRFGSLRAPNSEVMSAQESGKGGLINCAVGRWKKLLSDEEKQLLSGAIGKTLTSLGYREVADCRLGLLEKMKVFHIRNKLKLRRWLRLNTILGRLSVGRLLCSKDVPVNIKETSYGE
ncbi:sulfotransferase family protein [Thalassomonas haliotis]|uniref:Sulfotransferase n=1 Tax=Thalassomonas haliotis TaxID=485448 RepID=A0ABY7VKG9_9GAMM|nr:sulfotransferase [Thalassomonas haliotis]WDE13995.1 sulfotransferase [Thalassomonas haliotis]